MDAIILAAGVGRRLSALKDVPKSLLSFNGQTLLHRHLEALETCGVNRVSVVVGYQAHLIEDEVARYNGRVVVDLVFNDEFRRGSVLSLKAGLMVANPGQSVIVMDADVLFHIDVLRRLVEAEFRTGFLLDERSSAEGEEMMLGVRDGRVCTISRQIGDDWDLIGEGVGFFRLHHEDLNEMLASLETLLERGDRDADYETAIDIFLKSRTANFVPVDDLPWTEIDFEEDVVRARQVILPAIEGKQDKLGSAPSPF